jgi:hypothetical protein
MTIKGEVKYRGSSDRFASSLDLRLATLAMEL